MTLETSIQVVARIRPLYETKKKKKFIPKIISSSNEIAWIVPEEGVISQNPKAHKWDYTKTGSYTLDTVYDTSSTNESVYRSSVATIIERVMEGYHGSVFAYGQTSTGKTHTMHGIKDDPGIIPRAVKHIFRQLNSSQEEREYVLRVSYLEIYNELIRDLLHPTTKTIQIFDDTKNVNSNNFAREIIIKNLREEVVVSPEQVFALVAAGEAQRHVGTTHMNERSSRSHTVFRVLVESKSSEKKSVRVSSLNLIDLAGSESVKLTGATGHRQKEGHYINKSLMALGLVIFKLSEQLSKKNHGAQHIPYRDSKLTRLLQPSLSGNAQVCIICNISPQVDHLEESHNTLKFGTRAKKIKQRVHIKEVEDESTLIEKYKQEISTLKLQLEELKERQTESQKNKTDNHIDNADEEVEALMAAIQNVERLILKSRTPIKQRPSEPIIVRSPYVPQSGDKNDLSDAFYMNNNSSNNSFSSQPRESPADTYEEGQDSNLEIDDTLICELRRVQGLLGSVLKKKGLCNELIGSTGGSIASVKAALPFSAVTPIKQTSNNDNVANFTGTTHCINYIRNDDEEEIEQLRLQLKEQEVATSLRKADTKFLEKQLEEKELLLQEVSKVLEMAEKRHIELELENNLLRKDLLALRRAGNLSN